MRLITQSLSKMTSKNLQKIILTAICLNVLMQARNKSGRQGVASTALFPKSKKKCPDFKKKGSDWVHPYVKFTTQNVVLIVSKRKNFKIFLCGGFFSRIFDEIFIEVPWLHKTSLHWKFLVSRLLCAPFIQIKKVNIKTHFFWFSQNILLFFLLNKSVTLIIVFTRLNVKIAIIKKSLSKK